jgi:hypothetical protein
VTAKRAAGYTMPTARELKMEMPDKFRRSSSEGIGAGMARYVLVESRDPFESRDVSYFYGLAADLAAKGEQVTLFLVQNGVLVSRKGAKGNPLDDLVKGKVEVLADSFSLRERGIQNSERHLSVKPSDISNLVDQIMEEGTKVLWH